MERINIKPKEGLQIRKPMTLAFLDPKGETVIKSTFWSRRILSGDVVLTKKVSAKDTPVIKLSTKKTIKEEVQAPDLGETKLTKNKTKKRRK